MAALAKVTPMYKILICAGTRPEAIKLAPLVRTLRLAPEIFQVKLCSTGQHREMLHQAFSDFDLVPDMDLEVMTENQTLSSLSARLFTKLDALYAQEKPDMVIVQGDTTTVTIASMCAFYRGIKVGHVEAGLRSFDMAAPFPEEFNRRVASVATNLHFCPTERARSNLLRENVPPADVFVCGNTVIDALLFMVEKVRSTPRPFRQEVERALDGGRRMVLITAHRRESFGEGFSNICQAIRHLSVKHPDVSFIYPVHLNPNVQKPVNETLGCCPGVVLTKPLTYRDFVQLMDRSYLILSDSGGIQEEAPSLGKPVLVMREVTERPEGIEAGTSKLVGTDVELITREVGRLLTDTDHYTRIAQIKNPFGDGRASERIASILKNHCATAEHDGAHS